MRIRYRLLLGFMAIVAICILFGGYVYVVWQSINGDMETLDQLFESTSERALEELDAALHLGLELETTQRTLYEYILGEVKSLTHLRIAWQLSTSIVSLA